MTTKCPPEWGTEIGAAVLAPCLREGAEGDWWREQHTYCTGGHHIGAGEYVRCTCPHHETSPVGYEMLDTSVPVSILPDLTPIVGLDAEELARKLRTPSPEQIAYAERLRIARAHATGTLP